MKIAYIAAGAGNMYCGSCLHDNILASALLKKGHDVKLVPTYTPMRVEEENVSIDQVFYGGVNVYLKQKSSLFRNAPSFVDSLFNNRKLLRFVSRFSSSTDAKELGPLTIAVLEGEDGPEKTELMKLADWLKTDFKPEIIHLTNSLFAGFARELKMKTGAPILCSLQGEDLFLNDLAGPYRLRAIELLKTRARDVDGFIANSNYYSHFMSQYLDIPKEKIHVVRMGLDLRGHGLQRRSIDNNRPFVVGYLARLAPEKGFHLLVTAFQLLLSRVHPGAVRLAAAGFLARKDVRYFRDLQTRIEEAGWLDVFDYRGEVDKAGKVKFLSEIDVLCVPTVYPDPKGLFILEALANGVPVIAPRHGAFPELIELTKGGVLVDPESPESIADAIVELMNDAEKRAILGMTGQQIVRETLNSERLADNMLNVYQQYVL